MLENVQGYLKGDIIALRDPETGRVWFVTEATPAQAEIVTTGLDAWAPIDPVSLSGLPRQRNRRRCAAAGLRILP